MYSCQNIVQPIFKGYIVECNAAGFSLSDGSAYLGMTSGRKFTEIKCCEIAGGVAASYSIHLMAVFIVSVCALQIISVVVLYGAVILFLVVSQNISFQNNISVIERAVLYILTELPAQNDEFVRTAPPVMFNCGSSALDKPFWEAHLIILISFFAVHFCRFSGGCHAGHACAVKVIHKDMEKLMNHSVGQLNNVFSFFGDDRISSFFVFDKHGGIN